MTVAHQAEAGHQGVFRPSGAPPLLRVAGLALALAFAFPGVYLVYRNFAEGADPAGLLISDRTLGPLWRSVRLAVSVSGAALVLGTALAWLTTRTDLAWRRLWRVLLPLPLVFPTFVGAAAFIHTLNPGGLANDLLAGIGLDRTPELRGFYGAWLVLTLMTYPYVYLPVAARLRQLPGSLEESARVLGETALKVFGRICLPQIATAMGAGTLLVFLYTLSDFGAVQLMRYDTLTRAIATNQLANPPVALALSLLLLVLAALVVLAERRFSRSLPDAAAVQSSRPMVYDLGRWRLPALGFVALSAGAGVGAPLVALVDWAARGLVRSATGGRSLTIDGAKVLEATTNTLGASLVAAILSTAAVLPIALLVGRYRSRLGSFAHAVVVSTFALPGILIALSMRFWTLRSDLAFELLNDTMALLIFAYMVRFGSLAMGVTLVAVRSVPARLHDSARILGAGRLRRFFAVDLPMMGPGLLAGTGLVLLSVMKELPISLFVSPLGFFTLTTQIFGSFEEAFIAEAGIMAVVLVGLSFVLTWFLVIRRDHLM
ncbi:MAG: iron ABC transporter permease [Acidimicrobiaceae bacterium]|nr:iron ABC transporter permease [Acidimicrobiaceae bacterium]MDE0516353.1 iron ABC transporter permease [Acidimicrobiaceae bacterium]MDE0655918.1 iron ABC transporter permease [Acidimicrobiaceae bacterium]